MWLFLDYFFLLSVLVSLKKKEKKNNVIHLCYHHCLLNETLVLGMLISLIDPIRNHLLHWQQLDFHLWVIVNQQHSD